MSQLLLSRSPDLHRLMEEGYDVAVAAGHLLVRGVPYLDVRGRVQRGVLAAPLRLAADRTLPPQSHQAYFVGGLPCGLDGRPLVEMVHDNARRDLGRGLIAEHMLCSRPPEGDFPDYHSMMTTFVAQVANPAIASDPTVSARGYRVVEDETETSPFQYVDTASARAGITAAAERLAGQRVGIVGLGGTGSYILDLVAKTGVSRIHLFDADALEQHNAFRMAGAIAASELRDRPTKVAYYDRVYSRIHRGVIPHKVRLGPSTFHLLDHVDFVFLATDAAAEKAALVREIERRDMPMIDVGLGLHVTDRGLIGTVRVTTSTPRMRAHVWERGRIPMSKAADDDLYATNAQVADLNMLNAALAVVRWKRLFGFYADFENEHFSTYAVDGNHLWNEERRGDP